MLRKGVIRQVNFPHTGRVVFIALAAAILDHRKRVKENDTCMLQVFESHYFEFYFKVL